MGALMHSDVNTQLLSSLAVAKATREQAEKQWRRRIRDCYCAGISLRTIGKAAGVNHETVRTIAKEVIRDGT